MQPAATTTTPQPAQAQTEQAAQAAPAQLDIQISAAAIEAIAAQIKKRDVPGTSLRVGVRGGGCSGFSYIVEFHDGAPHPRDRVYDLRSESGAEVRVLIDPKSLIYLNGAVLEYENTLMRKGFKWKNPQEKAACGCGTSFSV